MLRKTVVILGVVSLFAAAAYADHDATASKITPNQDGENALNSGDYARALKVFETALQTKQDSVQEGYLRTGLGEAYLWSGDFSEARGQLQKAKKLLPESNLEMQARLLDDFSWLDQASGKNESAIALAKESMVLREKGDPDLDLVNSVVHVAWLYQKMGNFAESATYWKKALDLHQNSGAANPMVIADFKERLAALLWKMGKKSESDSLFAEALGAKNAAGAVWQRYISHPYWDDVTFRYSEGAPNCAKQFDNGANHALVNADGITVSAAFVPDRDDKKAVRLDLTVNNNSDRPVDFLSQPPSLTVLQPKVQMVEQVNPSDLASKVEKTGNRKAAWTRFWGQNATQTLTSTMYNSGGGGYWGGYPPMYAGGYYPNMSRSGNFSYMTQQVPDYAAQQRAMEKAAEITQKARDKAEQIREKAIGPSTINPGQSVTGSLYYMAPKAELVLFRVPIGNATFEFELPPK